MRTFYLVLALLDVALVGPALSGGAMLAAQAVERTDVPARGILRVTFDPRIMTWNDEFTDAGRRRLGFGLTGDTVGSRYIPALAALEQNVRTVTGDLVPTIRPQVVGPGDVQPLLPRFVASLRAGPFGRGRGRRPPPLTPEPRVHKPPPRGPAVATVPALGRRRGSRAPPAGRPPGR